ncbi:opioid-binding protein/cell adhesion molecule homolog [Montipora capricornis]|uniref:opioid-binding protein/cell adhesion molecule homolog n=1 Tax=Montipora capricornis TaxID=246305 RepID=UPI0035F146E9
MFPKVMKCRLAVLLSAIVVLQTIQGFPKGTIQPSYSKEVALEGSEVTLECLGDDKLTLEPIDTSPQWFKDNKTVEYNDKIRNEWVRPQGGEWRGFSLIIKNVSKEDAGQYRCEAHFSSTKIRPLRASRELEIFERVLNVTASQTNVTLNEGATTTLQCYLTYSEAINVSIFWLFDGKFIKAEAYHEGNDQNLSTTNVDRMALELKHVTRRQGGTYSCGALSADLRRSQKISVKIKDAEGPKLEVEGKADQVLTKGKNVTLVCVAVYPAASFVDTFWTFNGSRRILSNNGSGKYEESKWFEQASNENIKRLRRLRLIIYDVAFSDTGQYACVLNTSRGLRRKNFSILVTKEKMNTTPSPWHLTDDRNPGPIGTTLFIGLGLFAGFLMTVIVSFKLLRRRTRVRYMESIISSTDEDQTEFDYDVFVTYSKKDCAWVDKELLPPFDKNQVKYCVDHLKETAV